jgi:hypothetical protein
MPHTIVSIHLSTPTMASSRAAFRRSVFQLPTPLASPSPSGHGSVLTRTPFGSQFSSRRCARMCHATLIGHLLTCLTCTMERCGNFSMSTYRPRTSPSNSALLHRGLIATAEQRGDMRGCANGDTGEHTPQPTARPGTAHWRRRNVWCSVNKTNIGTRRSRPMRANRGSCGTAWIGCCYERRRS